MPLSPLRRAVRPYGNKLGRHSLLIALLLTPAVGRAGVVSSTYTGASGGDYELGSNWSPAGVPNNNGSTQFDVTIPANFETVKLTSNSATVNDLTFDIDTSGGFSGELSVAAGGNFSVTGNTTFLGTYRGSVAGILAQSTGAGNALVSLGTLTNFDQATNTLSHVVLSALVNGAGITAIKFNNADIITLDQSYIAVGAGGAITDSAGQNALRNLAHLTNGAFLDVLVTGFTTAGDFSVSSDSTLSIQSTRFKVSGNFANYDNATATLTGGTYYLSGSSGFNGVLQFNGDLVTNAATIIILNNFYQVQDGAGLNGLRNFAVNAANANLSLGSGASFTTTGDFTNNGSLDVSTANANGNSAFVVTGALTNYDPATGTLTGGTYSFSSDATASATIKFPNTGIVSNAASISLNGQQSQFTDTLGNNALRTLTTNTADGSLSLGFNASLTTPGLTNAGSISLFASASLTTTGPLINTNGISISSSTVHASSFTQTAGQTALDTGAILAADSTIKIQGGLLDGGGSLSGQVSVTNATINPGATDQDTDIIAVTGALALSGGAHSSFYISGTTRGMVATFDPITFQSVGGYDGIDVNGALTLGGALDITLYGNFTPSASDQFVLMTATSLAGTFDNVASGQGLLTTDGLESFVVYYGPTSPLADPNEVVLTDFQSVPEPASGLSLLMLLLFGIGARRRPSR